jgi:hypothetical protein
MNKLTLNNKDEDKKIITFTIHKEIKQKLRNVLAESKSYNLKKKSNWVNEAIAMLRENPDYTEIVRNAEGNTEEFVFDKIYMSFDQRRLFAEIRNEVVKVYPDITGPQAAVIRAAILSRLMRKN